MLTLLSLLLLTGCGRPCPLAQVREGQRCVAISVDGVDEVPVSFRSGDLMLEGTLSRPQGLAERSLPGVVLLHDSGPAGRDQTVDGQLAMYFGFEVKPFAELADWLSHEGFVVLRYDKRGCTVESGCVNNYPAPVNLRFGDLLVDAQAAVRFLSEQPGVNPEAIGVVGLGQGGQIAPLLDPETVRSLVLLAAPAEPVDRIMGYQREKIIALYSQFGATQQQLDEQTAPFDELLDGLGSLRAGGGSEAAFGGQSSEFWREWLEVGDRSLEAASSWPGDLIVVHGDYDWTVPVGQAALYEGSFGSRPSAKVVLLSELAHPFVRVSQPEWTEIRPGDIAEQVDESLFESLREWFNER